MHARSLALAAVVVIACGSPRAVPVAEPHAGAEVETPADPPRLVAELASAEAGVTNPDLRALLRDHWRWSLEHRPVWATELGVRLWDAKIEDPSLEARAAERAHNRELLRRAQDIPVARLDRADAVTHAMFVRELEIDIALEVCRFDEWTVDPRSNPVTKWGTLPDYHVVATREDAENLVARYRAIPAAIDATIERLGLGAKDGLFANAESTRRVIDQVERQLALDVAASPLLRTTAKFPAEARSSIPALEAAVADGIRSALRRYAGYLRTDIAPHARGPDRTGLAALPLGRACYDALVHSYTSLPHTADEVHEIGLDEIARIDREIAKLGRKRLKTKSLASTLQALRSDGALYFDSADGIRAAAREALDAARGRMPEFFGVLPKADCVVSTIPDYEAPYTTTAYYRPPVPDGSRPGEYFVNVFEPRSRPRFEARVLAVHESIPGHHLQIAISQELPAVPAFRRHGGTTVFVEGWALYTERLAEEMGLYRDDLDRLGMLSYDAWRAARLVVDTGIHAKGWSRQQAVDFMLAHTALSRENIDNEVDRYIVWPGQALAYKIGQLEMWQLRRAAERELGARFDLRSFHDAVLGGGALPLPLLRERVAAWVDSRRR